MVISAESQRQLSLSRIDFWTLGMWVTLAKLLKAPYEPIKVHESAFKGSYRLPADQSLSIERHLSAGVYTHGRRASFPLLTRLVPFAGFVQRPSWFSSHAPLTSRP